MPFSFRQVWILALGLLGASLLLAQSARNRFPGVVTRIEREGLVGLVEIQAGPHRIVTLWLHD